MRAVKLKSALVKSALGACVVLLGTGAYAQQQVALTAGPTSTILPDGTNVPMWGYTCGTPVTGSVATCAPLNTAEAAAGRWSPIVITVPAGQGLQVSLTNALTFTAPTSTNTIPTSLVILGQLGGGLGTGATFADSPTHAPYPNTWFTAGTTAGATFNPPAQGSRVQSMATEVATGATTALTWTAPKPGTYLLESGTHPSIQVPMGLYGMVVVTQAPTFTTTGTVTAEAAAGCAYPTVSAATATCTATSVPYDADVDLLMSEIDPVQNAAVQAAVTSDGFNETSARVLRDSLVGVNVTAGGSGYSGSELPYFGPAGVCSTMPTGTISVSGGAITQVNLQTSGAGCSAPPLVTVTPSGTGGTAATLASVLSLTGVQCSGNAPACYPPAVNYSPLYFLYNGQAFDRTNPTKSLFAAAPGTLLPTGQVLVRAVNAGLRMHVPSLVNTVTGALATAVPGMTLVAEDGNLSPPTAPRVQSEVFLAAGKTYDLLYTATAASQLTPVFDRELSLSGNQINRDSGMLGYITVGGATLPTGSGAIAGLGAAAAVADTYNSIIGGKTLTVADPGKGVLANDTNVFGAKIVVGGVAQTGAVVGAHGTITLNANGTFTYVANATGVPTTGTVDTFTYCGNGTLTGAACAALTLNAAPPEAGGGVIANNDSYASTVLSSLTIHAPGVLQNDTDAAGYPLTVKGATNAAPLTAALKLGATSYGNLVTLYPDGGFTISGVTTPGTYTFTYQAVSSQGTASNTATVTVTFPAPSNLQVTVLDPTTNAPIADYRWIIEEDQTFYVDPNCTTNPIDKTKCTTVTAQGAPFGFGTNFHTSHMPVVAAGCTGALSCESGQTLLGTPAVCDIGNGVCTTSRAQQNILMPSQVNLDPTRRYYISVLPGDASQPFATGYSGAPDCSAAGVAAGHCGHGMGGAAIAAPCLPKTIQTACTTGFAPVTVLTQPTPYPTGKLTVHVFEDDFPLDGIFSPGGGVDVVAPNEPGLGGFSVVLLDAGGGPGDATGQVTYDMFNQPLSNSLAGMIDPVTGNDACPLSPVISQNAVAGDGSQAGVMGMIVTCPKYESDGVTLSPMAGMAVIANLPPARYAVVANPGADRFAAGEEWLQTNTLDGQKGHDAFIRIGEPGYFQEYGPSGFHVDIGFANPAIINARLKNGKTGMCDAAATGGTAGMPLASGGNLLCNNIVKGHVTNSRLSRAPDQRIYGSRTRQSLAFTQCYVSLGDPDGFDFAFTKCDSDGNFTFTGIPAGNWKITTFDQWNDQIIDGITTPVGLNCPSGTSASGVCTAASTGGTTLDLGEIATHQWQANIYTRTFLDLNGNGISDKDANGNDTEPGLPLENVNNRWRDGSLSNFNNTDLNGYANYNEVFPLFNWYVFDSYTTRYKTTGVHVVMDAGGPVDVAPSQGSTLCNTTPDANGNATNGDRACGASSIAANMANTYDFNPLPADIALPGAIYCGLGATADCNGKSINPALTNTFAGFSTTNSSDAPSTCTPYTTAAGTVLGVTCPAISTGRIDPPYWFASYGWQGFIGQNQWLEYGKKPFVPGETGGIRGHVVYASTRPYDDPQLLLQNQWEPLVPRVTINLYQEGVAADGVTPTLTLIDHTTTSSFDDWAQGFRTDATGKQVLAADGKSGVPNISCPGQTVNDNLFYSLANQPTYLDWYNNVLHGTAASATALPYNSQFKCYDGMHSWNQLQPVPYDGLYVFPSVTGIDPKTGRPSGTNCAICTTNVDANDSFRYGGSTTAAPWVNGASQGTPVLPAGKYVVEVVIPPGYELVKEEDKNILIGDSYIAPATVQFPGLAGTIFILPDMASLSAQMNSNNPQNATMNLGRDVSIASHEGDTHSVESYWPCVGQARTVPDYLSLFPNAHQVSPFAGAVRNLCDRKEVILTDQSSAQAKFYIFTSTHVAAHFTGVILDDFTGEFDPFSPQWGEKFAPAYIPVSVKDWAGNEINRVYSDEFGLYNGLNYSTWEVNPPNPTGYSPTMMVMCMNESGHSTKSPWWDTAAAGTVSAAADPFFQPGYSTFCYELAFMPGQTGYFDTPVVPVASFSEGYNHPDCAYPDATPAVKEVDGDGIGPWIDPAGARKLTITALGDQLVENYGYSGPGATTAPFNQQKIKRHYGFGTGPGNNCGTNQPCVKLVTPDGASHPLSGVTWTDTQITGTVPTWTCNAAGTNCPLQQQAAFAAVGSGTGSTPTPIQSGQLVIMAANGRTSTDAVTVWIGGKAPTHVDASGTIQAAIDAAAPGDLIIVDPTCNATTAVNGTLSPQTCSLSALTAATPTQTRTLVAHHEMLQMYKPIRLQGVGGATSIIDADTQPAGKLLDPWRQRINCVVGLTPQGRPRAFSDTACSAGWAYASGGPDYPTVMADRLPFEAMLGWDASLNGNVAEQLIEPSLLGAYEGAAITVLAKGVKLPSPTDPQFAGLSPSQILGEIFGAGTTNVGAAFPTNTTLLLASDCATVDPSTGLPAYPTSFYCNPSSIDGLGIRNSSQGGGGIFVHAYGHELQIANNRIYNNSGTMGGGISVGLGEHADAQQVGAAPTQYPGSCDTTTTAPAGMLLPYCYNVNVNVHHNSVTLNSSMGDELFSSTPAGAGGVVLSTGDDNYRLTNNWVCGNLSVGDGGGVAHIGFSNNGQIANNTIIFNESTNPTITTNGGGLLLMGAPDADPITCGVATDIDCVPPPGTISPSDGIGRNVKVNANLILGNAADSGSGGGLRLQHVNGMDVVDVPNGAAACPNTKTATSCAWNSATVTNNIIANNVAGWDGGGVSLQDSLVVNIVNNTIVSNDTTASSGTLLTSLFAPSASAGANTGQVPTNAVCGSGQSCPQVSGLVATTNSPVLMANLRAAVDAKQMTCPAGHGASVVSAGFPVPTCFYYSVPQLTNDVIWQNHSYYIGVGGRGPGQQNKQNVVTLYQAFTNGAAPTQPTTPAVASNGTGHTVTGGTGACATVGAAGGATNLWEIGVRGDSGPSSHGVYSDSDAVFTASVPLMLSPTYSLLSDGTTDYAGGNNVAGDPQLAQFYCNGSRTPPENQAGGFLVPPGTIESNGLPNPIFTLTPSAVVDEGNNWVNMRWGPLSLVDPATGATLGNFTLTSGSAARTAGLNTGSAVPATTTDFFGRARPGGTTAYDIGAVEYAATAVSTLIVSCGGTATTTPCAGLNFGNVGIGSSATQTLTVHNATGGALADLYGAGFTGPFARSTATPGTCASRLASGANCTINVVLSPTAAGAVTGEASINASFPVNGSPVPLTGTGVQLPALTSIAPASVTRGNTTAVTLTGSNLTNASAVTVSGTGVTCTITGTPTATQVAANCATTATAVTGTRTVKVTTPSGTSNTVPLTVGNPAAPTLASISPNTGGRGRTYTVTLTGTSFTATGTTITVAGICTAATCPVTYTSATSISTTFTIGATAGLTAHNVSVTTPGGTSNTVPFTVTAATVAISPNPLALTVTGTGNTSPTGTVTLTNPASSTANVTITQVAFTGGSLTTWFFSAASDACTGATLAPGQSCTVQVGFTNVSASSGTNHSGAIRFTDSATGSPQSGTLTGHVN